MFAALAAFSEPTADDFLCPAAVPGAAVDVGGIEEVNAVLTGGIHDSVGSGLLGLWTEVHCPQAQPGDLEAGPAQMGVLHGNVLWFARGYIWLKEATAGSEPMRAPDSNAVMEAIS